jgi:hypothetical protein
MFTRVFFVCYNARRGRAGAVLAISARGIDMSAEPIEQRLIELERKVRQIESTVGSQAEGELPWWRRIAGRFAGNSEFDEAMRLGREYRQSLRTNETEKD